MNRSVTVLLVLAALGCASRKPSIERDPGKYAPAETDARKVTRLEERIHTVQDRVNAWTRELEEGRGHAADAAKLDGAIERLHAATRDLERLRLHANEVDRRAGEADDLEREALRIQGVAERAHGEGLETLGKTNGAPRAR